MLEKLRQINKKIEIKSIFDDSFKKFGSILKEFPVNDFKSAMNSFDIPSEGNIYIPSFEELETINSFDAIQYKFYGDMPIQIGYCIGVNSHLNGLEFHKCSEVSVAYTDYVILLGHQCDLSEENNFDIKDLEAYYVPEGTAYELFQTSLHLSPCKVTDEGFRSLVILTEGTNTPLSENISDNKDLLLLKNKWVITHPDYDRFVSQGVHVGIEGENLEILY